MKGGTGIKKAQEMSYIYEFVCAWMLLCVKQHKEANTVAITETSSTDFPYFILLHIAFIHKFPKVRKLLLYNILILLCLFWLT